MLSVRFWKLLKTTTTTEQSIISSSAVPLLAPNVFVVSVRAHVYVTKLYVQPGFIDTETCGGSIITAGAERVICMFPQTSSRGITLQRTPRSWPDVNFSWGPH